MALRNALSLSPSPAMSVIYGEEPWWKERRVIETTCLSDEFPTLPQGELRSLQKLRRLGVAQQAYLVVVVQSFVELSPRSVCQRRREELGVCPDEKTGHSAALLGEVFAERCEAYSSRCTGSV